MNEPPDVFEFLLAPNSDDDDPKAIEAVHAELIRFAAQHGIKIVDPGEIDPTAQENPERADKIKATTTPRLIEFTKRETGIVRIEEEERYPDGTLQRRRRAELIGQRTKEFSSSLLELKELAESAKNAVIEIATKVCKAVSSAVSGLRGSRKK